MVLAAHARTFDNGFLATQNCFIKLTRNMAAKGSQQCVLHPRLWPRTDLGIGAPRVPTNLLHDTPKTEP